MGDDVTQNSTPSTRKIEKLKDTHFSMTEETCIHIKCS